jgi:hypothetical protein
MRPSIATWKAPRFLFSWGLNVFGNRLLASGVSSRCLTGSEGPYLFLEPVE